MIVFCINFLHYCQLFSLMTKSFDCAIVIKIMELSNKERNYFLQSLRL